ncbi:MAG: tetratricopeptide repeat protein, partial [Pedobacter sp.]
MKPCALLLFSILICLQAFSQDPVLAANKCYDEKNYECAMGKYKEAIADRKYQEKDLPLIKYRIGYALNELKQYEDAIPYLKEALAGPNLLGEGSWSLAWAYYNTKNYALALQNYEKAIPSYTGNNASIADLHYGKGISNMGLYRYKDALENMRLSIQFDSTNSNCYSYSGEASYNLGKYEDAIEFYRKALQKSSTEVGPTAGRYYWIGKSYAKLKKYE